MTTLSEWQAAVLAAALAPLAALVPLAFTRRKRRAEADSAELRVSRETLDLLERIISELRDSVAALQAENVALRKKIQLLQMSDGKLRAAMQRLRDEQNAAIHQVAQKTGTGTGTVSASYAAPTAPGQRISG